MYNITLYSKYSFVLENVEQLLLCNIFITTCENGLQSGKKTLYTCIQCIRINSRDLAMHGIFQLRQCRWTSTSDILGTPGAKIFISPETAGILKK